LKISGKAIYAILGLILLVIMFGVIGWSLFYNHHYPTSEAQTTRNVILLALGLVAVFVSMLNRSREE